MGPNQILDMVLRLIYIGNRMELGENQTGFHMELLFSVMNRENILHNLQNSHSQVAILTRVELKEILDKLSKDGYMRINDVENSPNTYHMTFEGKWFIRQGGYMGEAKKMDEASLRLAFVEGQSLKNAQRMLLLTVVLAAGTLVTIVHEFVEIQKFPSFLPLLTSLFLFLCLGIALLIGCLIGIEIAKKIKPD